MIRKSVVLYLSWRFLFSNSGDKFISITKRLAFFGIMLGVATLIIVTSVMNGFRYEFMKNITGINGELALKSERAKGITGYRRLIKRLKGLDCVQSASPVISEQSLISYGGRYRGVMVLGIDEEDLTKNEHIGISDGTITASGIGVGTALVKSIGSGVGGRIKIISPFPKNTGFGEVPRSKTLDVDYTFSTGLYSYDSATITMPLKLAQVFFNCPESVSEIRISIIDQQKTDESARKIINMIQGDDLYLVSWRDSNKAFMNAVRIERNVMTLILALIILVATFNVISCMMMLVKDKRKDIAILRTMGLGRRAILKIFMLCGSAIGVSGALLGLIVGVLFAVNIESIKSLLERLTGSELFSGEIYFLLELPCRIQLIDTIMITVFAIVIAFLASIQPALRASKQDPAEILRYE